MLNGGAAFGSGNIGGGLVLSGSFGDYVGVASSSALQMRNRLSIVGWFKRNTTGGSSFPGAVEKRGEYRLLSSGPAAPSSKWRFDIRNSSDTAWVTMATVAPIANGVWQHIAATYDGTIMKLYVNGVLNNTMSTAAGIKVGNGLLEIGRRDGWVGFPGAIDELYIYKAVLTAAEINEIMNF
jgi:hypothetical protein